MKSINKKIFVLLMIAIIIIPLNVRAIDVYDCDGQYCDPKSMGNILGSAISLQYEISKIIADISVCKGGAALCFSGDVESSNGLGGRGLYLKIVRYNDDKTETVIGTPILLWNGSFLSTVSSVYNNGHDAKRVKYNATSDENNCKLIRDITFDGASIISFERSKIKYYLDDSNVATDITTQYDKNLPTTAEEIVNYVKTYLIGEYFIQPTKMKNYFKLTANEYQQFFEDMDKYYFAFEPAYRSTLVTSTDGLAEIDRKELTATPTEGYVDKTVWWKCSVSGETKITSGNKPTDACKSCKEESDGSIKCTTGEWNWIKQQCDRRLNEYNQKLIVHYYSAPSYVKPARYTNSVSLIAAMSTGLTTDGCNSSAENGYSNCVQNPVLKKDPATKENIHVTDSNGKKLYEYYVGPTLKTALVGWEDNAGIFHNNKYKLVPETLKLTDNNLSTYKSQNYAIGVSYWWAPNIISCKKTCEGKTNDGLLQCAEQFCDNAIGYDDRMNTQSAKLTCIQKTCGYEYTPMKCDNPIVNPYIGHDNYTIGETTKSTCSILDIDGKTKTEDSKKIITKCEAYDENKKIFDQKTYLIVACKESSSFQYADLSKTRIIAGEGLNYFANLQGGKECTVSFDIDTWKVAYASYHSEDQVCVSGILDDKGNCIGEVTSSRKLLENILNYYNKCSLGANNDEETKKLCDIGGDAIGIDLNGKPVETTWTSLGYNTNKVEVKTSVAEVINDKKVKSENYTLIKNGEKTDNSITANKEQDAYSFAYNKRQGFGKVKTYLSTSNVEANYTFDKYCVTTDGKATVYKANAAGKCKQDETGIESKEVFGKNVYYTSFKATPTYEITSGNKHAIEYTTATVKNENEMSYLSSQEYCPYEIETNGLSCSIEIELQGATTTHGADIYDGPIRAKLKINNQLGTTDTIVGTGLNIDEQSLNGLTEIEVDMNDSRNGAEIRDIYGIVTTKNGKTVTCDKQVKLVEPCNQQVVKCEVSTVSRENKLYEIETNSPKKAFYALTNDIREYVNKNHPLGVGFKTILQENNKNIVKAYEISESSRLYGMVTDSTGGYCVCWEDIGIRDWDPEIYNCKKEVNRSKVKEVQDFCEKNWQKDISNYSSSKSCIEDCKCSIPHEVNCEIGNITNYCEARYRDCEFEDVSTCINYVYNNLACSGTDYIYRPINNSNPFPNSYESPIPGDRIIGGNWVGRTQYITDDSSDSTSVTGANAGVNVEYEINLTPSIIQDIRKNTESYINSGKNPYLDYISVEEGKDGYCLEEGYCSEFINSSEFSTIFKVK